MFHEGGDPVARLAFQQIARLSGGAFCTFDSASARQLRELLSAVAVSAAGGRRALAAYSRRTRGLVPPLTHQGKYPGGGRPAMQYFLLGATLLVALLFFGTGFVQSGRPTSAWRVR